MRLLAAAQSISTLINSPINIIMRGIGWIFEAARAKEEDYYKEN